MASSAPAQAHRWRPGVLAGAVGAASSVAFALVRPGVSDLWASRAREYAADHGVGLTYWFAWYGGTVPGHYSVLGPYLTRALTSVGLISLAAAVVTALLWPLLAGTRHPELGTAVGVVAVACNLWSGRVVFLAGTAVALVVVLLVRSRRPWWAAAATLLACAVTPVTGAFLALGMVGTIVVDVPRRRAALAVIVAAIIGVGALALAFGSPGPEGFRGRDVVFSLAALLVLIPLRPRSPVFVVTLLSLPLCAAVALVPNGLGSNFERMVWFVLPVACVATARTRHLAVIVLAGFPLGLGVAQTYRDLHVAADPLVSFHFYDGLNAHLDRLPGLQNYRVEVVPTATHADSFELLGHAQQARGDETQSDKGLHDVVTHSPLSANVYRRWLDDNAIGYVVLTRHNLKPNAPEATLVRDRTPPYLHEVWSDSRIRLFAVADPTPIVPLPGRVDRADQAGLDLRLPAGTYRVRVRWSPLLTLRDAPAGTRLSDDHGWLRVRLLHGCSCRLSG